MEEMMQRGFNDNAPEIINASEPHMACLFLVDTSGSMGVLLEDGSTPIEELNKALNRFKVEVCEDRKTRDILDVATVQFGSEVNVVQPFRPVEQMQPVSLTLTGSTNMAGGLRMAIDMIIERGRLYRRTGTQPYCPWIVMITDGYPDAPFPADALAQEIESLDQQDKLRLWSLAVSGADTQLLNKLGHGKRSLVLKGYDFSKFFDWANKSMRSISVSSPGERAKGVELPDNVSKNVDSWM